MKVDSAIARFTAWDQPWRFHDSVAAELGGSELALFERIWAEANEPRHWQTPDLALAGQIALQSLRARFAQCGDAALSAVVRAAAYQWR